MKVTFFSHAFPPLTSPRSIQVARLAAHLDIPITVVCGDDGAARDPSLLRLLPTGSDTEVLRWAEPRLSAWTGRLRSRLLPRVLNAPDRRRSWAMSSARRLRRTRGLDSRDILVTFGSPMSDHLAGLRTKRMTGVRWVAHFSDPWADNPLDKGDRLTRRLVRHWESRVIETADVVIFTSAETLSLVMAKYPVEWAAKARVLPHAFDPNLYPRVVAHTDTEKVVIRHVGSFYSDRSPEPLFRGLVQLNERRPDLLRSLSIELVGTIDPRMLSNSSVRALPPYVVRLVSPVDYLTSLRLMSEADMLLVIDAPADLNVFFPSKLVDYIGARRPIVGISPEGTSASIIRKLGGLVAHPRKPEEIARVLEETLSSSYSGSWGDEGVRARYCAPEVAKTFQRFLE